MAQDLAASQRRLSNVGHWAEGALFAALGVLTFLQARGSLTGSLRYVPSLALLGAGIVLPVFLFGHSHGREGHSKEIASDPQQRQHLVMAGLLLVSGAAELSFAAGWLASTVPVYVFPASLAIIGVMFMLHTQHGDHAAMAKAVRFHRLLGAVILSAGVARAVAMREGVTFAYASGALLLVVAALLVTYREPSGAYAGSGPGAQSSGGH